MAEFRNTFLVRNKIYQNDGPPYDQFVLADNAEQGALKNFERKCNLPIYILENATYSNFSHQDINLPDITVSKQSIFIY